MSIRIIEDGHISSPQGFRSTGVACGLKEIKARDLALVYSLQPARAAAIFTTNAIAAAPVFFDQAVLARNRDRVRAVLINSGHANVATGPQGLTNAVDCAKIAADELEVPRDSVLLLSSGRIGTPLPMNRMREGIRRAASELDSGGGRRAALAILTNDSRPKDRAISITLGERRSVAVAGMAKGGRASGVHAATMLCVLTSDVSMDARLLTHSLEEAVAQSFGRLALDYAPSPNDAVLLLANGAAELPPITDADSWEYGAWREGLTMLCADLAQQVARDTAGKLLYIRVRGAASASDARMLVQAVMQSSVVRSASTPNSAEWNGILVAIGAAGVELRPDLLEIRLGSVVILREGIVVPPSPTAGIQSLSNNDIELTVDLHLGTHSATGMVGMTD